MGLRVVRCRSVIILVIHKSDSRFAVVQFRNHSYDNRPNRTPLSPITIITSPGLFVRILYIFVFALPGVRYCTSCIAHPGHECGIASALIGPPLSLSAAGRFCRPQVGVEVPHRIGPPVGPASLAGVPQVR